MSEIKLKPCPFCGGEAERKFIGNDHTKKRSIEIKCKKCRVKRVDAALSHSHDWIDNECTKQWNERKIDWTDTKDKEPTNENRMYWVLFPDNKIKLCYFSNRGMINYWEVYTDYTDVSMDNTKYIEITKPAPPQEGI